MRTERPKTTFPHRTLQHGQRCVVETLDIATGRTTEVLSTADLLLEAPNWIAGDTLIVNGDGVLWRLSIETGELERIDVDGLPNLNNDHVAGVERDTMFVSGFDGHLHRVDLEARTSVQVTADDPARPMFHFLHGVSPDGKELAFVGLELQPDGAPQHANIFTISSSGGSIRQLTTGTNPADGPEYSPDGKWIYFNTEAFSQTAGHAQIARMRPNGSDLTQLTFDDRVNWFPHLAPAGDSICFLSYPPGTTGHPADLDVELRLVTDGDWTSARTVVRLFGGQGTINVNSWSPDSSALAYIAYPFDGA
jgi:hypothetical protein